MIDKVQRKFWRDANEANTGLSPILVLMYARSIIGAGLSYRENPILTMAADMNMPKNAYA